jgi:hypothetical protein
MKIQWAIDRADGGTTMKSYDLAERSAILCNAPGTMPAFPGINSKTMAKQPGTEVPGTAPHRAPPSMLADRC